MYQQKVHPQRNLIKEGIIQIGAGGSAGFVEVCIMHPMDLVKTRFQLQVRMQAADATYYTGIIDCMHKMCKSEGVTALWKGLLPPIIVETPKRAVKTFSCAGFFAGVTEGVLVNPFEVIKVKQQSNRVGRPSTAIVTREIISKYGFGLNGLYRGLSATIMRNAVFNSFYFGFYHSVKNYIPVKKDPLLEFGTKVGLGFVSGTVASCLNIPFDVAKSRIQGPQGNIQYKGTLNTICIIYKNEGFKALYKGLLPKVLRLGPGGAIMLVVYDYMHVYLTEKFSY
ncbi:PREDICTED: mitochondrial 2-oxodicarboxylate carrier isoform X2 [Polistes canadensis]|uniref:mitochondrial 2-oxodicarboxylate carrier isoform X2 n=1 Tax=Polistes canadensis TaxID=91411 RepID=UPI000718C9D1|nr:PREDICTED: mitochondrial 2-oxodicarboxylate carrier isoform X2 [Polistes canadensis]